MDDYECNQTATSGPVLPHLRGATWTDHLTIFCLLLAIFIISTLVTWYNLTILYQFNPGYKRRLEAERAFCQEIDKTFISRHYYYDESELVCKAMETEAKR